MKVILQVDGREMTFSKVESISIVEEESSGTVTSEPTEKIDETTTDKKEEIANRCENVETVQKPEEGKWFEVNPETINQKLFKEERADPQQEETRKLIQEAFAAVKSNPEKYASSFKTLMPEKTWNYKTVAELKELATILGDHMADWVEQALEWAQRIQNGESWENLCNDVDTANCYRLIAWKNGYTRVVGGSRRSNDSDPASVVYDSSSYSDSTLYDTVPLVVL